VRPFLLVFSGGSWALGGVRLCRLCPRCNRLLGEAGDAGRVLKATGERWFGGILMASSRRKVSGQQIDILCARREDWAMFRRKKKVEVPQPVQEAMAFSDEQVRRLADEVVSAVLRRMKERQEPFNPDFIDDWKARQGKVVHVTSVSGVVQCPQCSFRFKFEEPLTTLEYREPKQMA
jgi:hypothetical protein